MNMIPRLYRNMLLSAFSGFLILLVAWFYQNYDFSFSVEDGFMKKFMTARYNLFHHKDDTAASFIFLNTGKNLALVDDSAGGYGNVAVSDRRVLLDLMNRIGRMSEKPRFTVMDIEFYYPFTPDLKVDTLLGAALSRTKNLVIPTVADEYGNYRKPLFDVPTGYANYRRFGPSFAKFRLVTPGPLKSLPVVVDEALNNRRYEWHGWYATCNDRLCLRSIWPGYPLTNDLVVTDSMPKTAVYFELGEFLDAMKTDSVGFRDVFKNRILIVGNFLQDTHPTPVGMMAGSVLIANIYLSLFNRQQIVPYGFFLLLFFAFSGLSYLAWFSKMPEINIRAKFLASYLTKFVRSYISYFGSMVFLSLLSVLLFHIQVALFVPSFLFSWIEYVKHFKGKGDKTPVKPSITAPLAS